MRRFVVAFAAALAGLFLISFIAVPGWPLELWQAGEGYFDVQPFAPPVAMLSAELGGAEAGSLTWVFVILLGAWLVWVWWRSWGSGRLPVTAVAATLTVTTLIAPRTSMVNQAPLLLPVYLVLADLVGRGWRGKVAAGAIQAILVGGMWALDTLWFPHLQLVHMVAQQRVIAPIMPVLALVLLTGRVCLIRRGWRLSSAK